MPVASCLFVNTQLRCAPTVTADTHFPNKGCTGGQFHLNYSPGGEERQRS